MARHGRTAETEADGGAGSGAGTTVVLGFDALSAAPLDAYDLPNFDALRERGVSAPLDSTFPPWTGSAWPSMYTGVDPGHHGVFSFFDFEGCYPGDADLISRRDVRAPALWNYLSEAGLTSTVLNVPVTHPAEPIDGVLVPGYLAPESAAGYPEDVRAELSDSLDEEYRIYATREVGDADEAMLRSFVELIDHRRRAAEWLLRTYEPDVAIFQVQKTDSVFHKFDGADAHRRVYEAADRFLGAVLDAAGPGANVIVCSDHGIGPARGYNVYVNEILRNAGLLEATEEGTTPTLGGEKGTLAGDDEAGDEGTGVAGRAVSRLARTLSSVGVEPGDVYAAASRLGVDGHLRRLVPDGESVSRHVDWAASRAYCRCGPELGVRINLQGREPAGVVPRSEYDAVREAVIEALEAARTPEGGAPFEWVKPREAVYDGPHAEAACDVLFQPAGMNHVVATNLIGSEFVPIDKYTHKTTGVFVGAGPAVDGAADPGRLDLTDVAPTTMALAGAAVPERMTGSVPPDLLDEPVTVRSYGDVPYGAGSDESSDDRVEARLEDLGYL